MLGTLGSWAYSSIASTVFAEATTVKSAEATTVKSAEYRQPVVNSAVNKSAPIASKSGDSEKLKIISNESIPSKIETVSKTTDDWGDDFFEDFSKSNTSL